MRSKIKQFPEITQSDLDLKTGRLRMSAKPGFDQYVALQHSLEEAGGAISMFDVRYIVPRAYYGMLGVKGRDADKAERLENNLRSRGQCRDPFSKRQLQRVWERPP